MRSPTGAPRSCAKCRRCMADLERAADLTEPHPAVPGSRQLDRRRSRRPPACDRRHDARRAEATGGDGVRPLRRGGARTRRRTVDVAVADARQPGARCARAGQPGSVAPARRRAVPARADRRLRAPAGHRRAPGSRPARAAGGRRRASRMLRPTNSAAICDRGGRLAGPPRQRTHRAPARRSAAARRRRVRISRRHARPAPELRCASKSVVAELLAAAEVCSDYRRAGREPSASGCCRANWRTRGRWSRRTSTTATGTRANWPCSTPRANCARAFGRARDRAPHRLAHRDPVAICSKSRCCRRSAACSAASSSATAG